MINQSRTMKCCPCDKLRREPRESVPPPLIHSKLPFLGHNGLGKNWEGVRCHSRETAVRRILRLPQPKSLLKCCCRPIGPVRSSSGEGLGRKSVSSFARVALRRESMRESESGAALTTPRNNPSSCRVNECVVSICCERVEQRMNKPEQRNILSRLDMLSSKPRVFFAQHF
jgi:hypothetical protein